MKKDLIDKNPVVKLSFEFALDIIAFCELLESRRKFVVANQLLKCGTSIGANVWEAQNAESKNDFIHKFKIAAKESNEAEYWLLLCRYANNYPEDPPLLDKLESISKLVNKIISTSKINNRS